MGAMIPCSDLDHPTVFASAVFPCSLYFSRCKDLCRTFYFLWFSCCPVDHFIRLLCFFLFLVTFFFHSTRFRVGGCVRLELHSAFRVDKISILPITWFYLPVLERKSRASCMLGKCSTIVL